MEPAVVDEWIVRSMHGLSAYTYLVKPDRVEWSARLNNGRTEGGTWLPTWPPWNPAASSVKIVRASNLGNGYVGLLTKVGVIAFHPRASTVVDIHNWEAGITPQGQAWLDDPSSFETVVKREKAEGEV